MPITVRPATLADEEAVLDLIPQLFAAPGAPAPEYTRDRGSFGFRWAVERADADVLLAFDGDALVGLSSVYADIQSIRYGPRCWLQDLVVSDDHRGEGIGAQLIAASVAWAKEHGCTHLELASGAGRVDAHRFYRARGMTQSMDFMLWLGDA
ncbi:MAG: GNAT family N-acetyltransferase [Chloroflexota bacterium]